MVSINPIQAVLMMAGVLLGAAFDGLLLVIIGIAVGFAIGLFIKNE